MVTVRGIDFHPELRIVPAGLFEKCLSRSRLVLRRGNEDFLGLAPAIRSHREEPESSRYRNIFAASHLR